MSRMSTMTDFIAAFGSAMRRRRDAWRFYRMANVDPRIFQDIGVGQGEAERTIRCGRESTVAR